MQSSGHDVQKTLLFFLVWPKWEVIRKVETSRLASLKHGLWTLSKLQLRPSKHLLIFHLAVHCLTHDYVANLAVGLASDLIINSKINVLHMASNKLSRAAKVHNLPNGPWQKQTVGCSGEIRLFSHSALPGSQISGADLQTRQILSHFGYVCHTESQNP